MSQLVPGAPDDPKIVENTARVIVLARMEPQWRHQASSTRGRINCVKLSCMGDRADFEHFVNVHDLQFLDSYCFLPLPKIHYQGSLPATCFDSSAPSKSIRNFHVDFHR